MKKIDFDELKQLLEEKHFEEAKIVLVDYFNSDLTDEERGAVLTNLALVYMSANTMLNEEYAAHLKEILDSLKEIDQIEAENKKAIDIAEAQKKIQGF